MKTVQKLTAEKLLKVKAIKLQPSNPFTWASGWKSPIYCDNRKLMSYPSIRNFIKVEFARIILEKYPQTDAIAGVATGAIAPGALVADLLDLPFVYIRSTPKDHGLENLIEGDLKPKQKVVVIEDLVSTGGSSLKAVEAIRSNGSDVLGMLAIFTYGFTHSIQNMHEARVDLTALSNYDAILDEALATDYIDESELKTLQDWRKNPETWGQSGKNIKI
ncbi:MAG: orotate phosphoribosyltransferase [Fermentimonas sp.]|nr:orotate phosphoribosyltransferase [Fermentimonas sp.]